jgi:hypothetical protein
MQAFISRNRRDKEVAREIAIFLAADNIAARVDEWVVSAGDSIDGRVDEGLADDAKPA